MSISTTSLLAGHNKDDNKNITEPQDVSGIDAFAFIHEYLSSMENRQLDKAQEFLAKGFIMEFPGSGELKSIDELIDWAKNRYKFVKKKYKATNVAYETNKIIVLVTGTLYGQWPNGSSFEGIRFIDRFEIINNKITRQDVWNDLALNQPSM